MGIDVGFRDRMDDQKHRALLTEYQVCQNKIHASGNWVWQGTGVMIGAAFIALAFIGQTAFKESSPVLFGATLFLGLAIIPFMKLLRKYYEREQWRQKVAYSRMDEIEAGLGCLRISTTIRVLDHWEREEPGLKYLPGGEWYYRKKHEELPVRRPAGFRFLRWATILIEVLAGAWIILALLAWQKILL